MRLEAFSVENYRAFARRQDIEIRPLTLFFGWNSGGKSALVRFLPLLAESVRVGGPPIWLAGEVGRGATWPELVCKSTERNLLRFALRWKRRTPELAEWDIGGDLGGRWQEINSLVLSSPASEPSRLSYNMMDRVVGPWTGLLPQSGADAETEQDRRSLAEALGQLSSDVQWISGLRVRPPRLATYGGGAPPTLRPDGGDAVDHLIAAQLRSTADPLLDATQQFFSAVGEHLILDNPIESAWRVMLHPTGAAKVRVNLCDTGEGYAQVLPVLVALARARVAGPRLLCLEQPELHLHTRAQAELAKLMVASAKDPAEPRILVETHSEVLLTSVQLAIARGDIAHDMVRVYWVESRPDGTSDATPVSFDERGRPLSTAIVGAFDEAIRLGQELLTLQLPKRSS